MCALGWWYCHVSFFCFVLFCFVLFCFVLFCFVCLFVCLFVRLFVCLFVLLIIINDFNFRDMDCPLKNIWVLNYIKKQPHKATKQPKIMLVIVINTELVSPFSL